MAALQVSGHMLETDPQGYLCRQEDWTPAVAEAMAAADGIALRTEHWEIIEFCRSYYAEHGLIPIMRILARAIGRRLGEEKGKSRYLYRLFPEGPVRQASRYAGLPRPPSCI